VLSAWTDVPRPSATCHRRLARTLDCNDRCWASPRCDGHRSTRAWNRQGNSAHGRRAQPKPSWRVLSSRMAGRREFRHLHASSTSVQDDVQGTSHSGEFSITLSSGHSQSWQSLCSAPVASDGPPTDDTHPRGDQKPGVTPSPARERTVKGSRSHHASFIGRQAG
jgi:hypothetical protein